LNAKDGDVMTVDTTNKDLLKAVMPLLRGINKNKAYWRTRNRGVINRYLDFIEQFLGENI